MVSFLETIIFSKQTSEFLGKNSFEINNFLSNYYIYIYNHKATRKDEKNWLGWNFLLQLDSDYKSFEQNICSVDNIRSLLAGAASQPYSADTLEKIKTDLQIQIRVFCCVIRIEETKLLCAISRMFIFGWEHFVVA